jgi:signal transduction histidine kinase
MTYMGSNTFSSPISAPGLPAMALLNSSSPHSGVELSQSANLRPWAKSPAFCFSVAVMSVAAALGLRLLYGRWVPNGSPFLFFAPAVMFSAWYGGRGPGLVATILGAAAADYFLLEPVGDFYSSPTDLVRITVFVLVGLQISWLSGALRRARQLAEEDARAARRGERLLAQAHTQLELANDQLEMRVRQRTAELEFRKGLLEAQSNASLDGVLAVADDGSIAFVNRRLAQIWALPQSLFEGTLDEALDAMRSKLADDRQPLGEEKGALRGDGESPLNLVLADGRTLECYNAAVRGSDGRSYARAWFYRDITERRRFSKAILEAAELERQRIAQELHDDLCQQLMGITCLGRSLEQHLAAPMPGEAANAQQIRDIAEGAMRRAKELAKGLQPVELHGGLGAALLELAKNVSAIFGVPCHFRGESKVALSDPAAPIHLYRIAQEAIHNAVRHGRAKNVYVDLVQVPGRVILSIEDDGIGICEKAPSQGLGLRSMRHRARMIGGTLCIERGVNAGTLVTCQISSNISKSIAAGGDA